MLCAALLAAALTGCGGHDGGGAHRPATVAGKQQRSAPLPVPRGKGSKLPSDFNGDGAPDLVLDDLAHDGLGDDPGIGVVYGRKGHGLVAGTRQLLTPAKYAARIKGQAPATFASRRAATSTGTATPTSWCRRTRRTTVRACRRYRSRSSSARPPGSPARASR